MFYFNFSLKNNISDEISKIIRKKIHSNNNNSLITLKIKEKKKKIDSLGRAQATCKI